MAKQTGSVEFFKDDKGYGFIRPDGGGKDVFVHHSVIQMDGFKSLKRGDRVEFEIQEDPKGPRASEVRRIDDAGGAAESDANGGGSYADAASDAGDSGYSADGYDADDELDDEAA